MINIDENLCKGCHLCLFICYKNVYAISKEPNKKGVLLPYPKFEERCTSCGDCEIMCPDQAISVNVNKNWWKNEENDFSFNPKFSGAIKD